MKKRLVKLMFIFSINIPVLFYSQEITLDKIYSGYYRGKGINGISSMNDGDHYSVLEPNGIAKYSYKNTQKIGNIVDGKFQAYWFSGDEKKVLLLNDSQPIYRHSFNGKFEVKDLQTGKTVLVNNGNWIQEPQFSPDGNKIAFIANNDLYFQDLNSGNITQITFDGKKNHIINGLADWVYEEEFAHASMYHWNKAGDAIVFVKFDETNVPEISLPIYEKGLYPTEMKFKYPKAGEENSKVSAHIYQLDSKKILDADLKNFENYYISQVFQTNHQHEIVLTTSNRHHNRVDVIKIDTKTGSTARLFTETDKSWIDTDNFTLEFLDDNSFLWASERDGYRHLYWYDASGKVKKQITKGSWEITDYYGFNSKTKEVLVQTTEKGSINKVISKININTGKSILVSEKEGNNSANFSKNFSYFINTTSSAQKPNTFTLKDGNGKLIKELQNNDELLSKLEKDNFAIKEFFTIPNGVGDEMNAWILKPKDFNPNKKYPVLMYVYGGPGSQQVSNSWDGGNAIWFNVLLQKGYIVVCVDGRGTGYKGAAFKKSVYKQLGKYEIEDQITAAKWLGKQSYVDTSRIGMFGWSFGGYMSSLAMTKGADVFKAAIAVAPVTNWRYYDTVYTERFMQTPQENPSGYDDNSPINFAHLLKGKYLLIHGTADDNVHFQNATEMAESLIQQNKQFDFMTYPDKNHGIYGGKTRQHLYQKMTDFIISNL